MLCYKNKRMVRTCLNKRLIYLKKIVVLLFLITTSQMTSQDILWEKSYGGIHSEYLFDAQPTADYGFILAGSSLSGKSGNKNQDNKGDFDYWIWKMDERGDLDWQKSFGGVGADFLNSIQNTKDGGFILAGTSRSNKSGDKKNDSFGQDDYWIIKLNAEGGEEWQKTIGGSGQELLKAIRLTQDGGYIIGGSSGSSVSGLKTEPNYGSLDYWIVKLAANGTIEWQKTYGGQFSDKLESIEQTRDGGYILGGWSNSPKSGNKNEDSYGEGDFWILKLDKKGEIEWQRTLGGEQDDHLYVIFESNEGGFYAGGNTRSQITGTKDIANGKGADFWVLRLSENGEIVWQKTYDFGENDILTSMLENEDGTLLIGGHAKTENTGLSRADKKGINDYLALKIDNDGEEIWRQTIGSEGEDVLKKLVETRDGGYLLTGTSRGEPSRDKNTRRGRSDFWTVKLRDKDKKEKERYEGLEAFPNPTTGYTNVVVNHDFDEGTLRIFDINGREIKSFSVENRLIPVSLQGLSSGIYIINIKTNITTDSVKILKSN